MKTKKDEFKIRMANTISSYYPISPKDIIAAYDKLQSWDELLMIAGLVNILNEQFNDLVALCVKLKQ